MSAFDFAFGAAFEDGFVTTFDLPLAAAFDLAFGAAFEIDLALSAPFGARAARIGMMVEGIDLG